MLGQGGRKLSHSGIGRGVDLLRADVTTLPLKDGAVRLSLATHLFYFVARWREAARELLRVTAEDGAVLLLQTGGGREVPELRERYRELCGQLGFLPRSVGVPGVGVESTREVLGFYESEGLRVEPRAGTWKWTERVPLAEALGNLAARSYSFTYPVPDSVHRTVLSSLEDEVSRTHPSPSFVFDMENAVTLAVVTRD